MNASSDVVKPFGRRMKKTPEEILPCIPSLLDDYGLSAVEFRVFCRVARRAGKDNDGAWEGVRAIASACGLSVRSVRYALKLLVTCNLLTRFDYAGDTSEYVINLPAKWRKKEDLQLVRSSLHHHKKPSSKRARTPARKDRGGLHQMTGERLHPRHRGVLHLEIPEGIQEKVFREGIQ